MLHGAGGAAESGVDAGIHLIEGHGHRGEQQPADEREAPGDVAAARHEQAADDAADPGDASAEQHQQRRGEADEGAAAERKPGREVGPVDGHRFLPFRQNWS